MVDLPYEVWLHIAEYVPVESLPNLLGVNRALFNIYMDWRYHNPLLDIHSREGFMNMMHTLTDVSIARRVRVFALRFKVESLINNPQSIPRGEKRLAKAFAAFRAKKANHKQPKLTVRDTILRAVEGMTNVTTFLVSCYEDHPFYQEIANTAWKTFGHNIQSLTLDVSAEALWKIFPPFLSLPSLTNLTLTVARRYFITDPAEAMRDVFVPLLVNHSANLQSLSIIAFDCHFDLSELLPSIETFQNLTRLIICQPFISAPRLETFRLERILISHSSLIRNLYLRFYYPGVRYSAKSTWHSWRFIATGLPKLTRLTLNPKFFYDDMARMGSYVRSYNTTLRRLVFTGRYLMPRDFNALIANLGRLENMWSFEIPLDTLTHQHLDTLMRRMPQIYHLVLKFRDYDVRTAIPSESPGITFRRELTEYTSWEVRELVLPMDTSIDGSAIFGSAYLFRTEIS